MHQNGDEGFLCNFLYNYLSKEQRDELGRIYWLQGVGTMGEYAGNAEMVLFTRLFGVYLLIAKNTVNGPEIQSSRMCFHQTDLYPFSKIACTNDAKGNLLSPATLDNTIFLWVIDPADPCTAYKGGHVCEHYVTLNLLEPTHDLVHPDMFTFALTPPSPPKKDSSETNVSEDDTQETHLLEKDSLEKDSLGKESSEKDLSEKELSEKESSKKDSSENDSSEKE
jgi:hypothetical protein